MRKFGGDEHNYWDHNPYYNPENCGLEMIAVLEDEKAWYEFDTTIVAKDIETGNLFMAMDSGCSCPTPFEDYDGLDKMTPIRSIEEFDAQVDSRQSYWAAYTPKQIRDAREKVKAALN